MALLELEYLVSRIISVLEYALGANFSTHSAPCFQMILAIQCNELIIYDSGAQI